MSDARNVFRRVERLREEINRHRYLYHVLDRQEISDAALDSLKHELERLEAGHPDLVTPDSPTQRIAGKALAKFKKIPHRVRMTSLNDAFSEGELTAWSERIKKIVPDSRLDYFAEAKGDGFAVSLRYSRGLLRVGSTRGDGLVGEDVTQNVRTIDAIPLRLRREDAGVSHREFAGIFEKFPRVKRAVANLPDEIEVRGEVFVMKDAFRAINREQAKNGLPVFANPRNFAAGSVRQLDPAMARRRKLTFFAWDLVSDLGQETHEEEHLIMRVLGFPTVPLTRRCSDLDEVVRFWKEVGKKRERLGYLIDGIVVQVNNGKIFERMGVVGKAPRGAIAFKFPGAEATTVVLDIIVQIGRTGILTPVAALRPVQIGGVTVSRATLHNLDEIQRLDVRIGDTVVVERAGDVIPALKQVLLRLRPRGTRVFRMPKRCPICDSAVVRRAGAAGKDDGFGVGYYCSNRSCAAVQRENLYHFVSKHALDISGLGPKNIDALLASGLIRDSSDLFHLKQEHIEELPRFAEKSAEHLISAIREKRNIPLARFLFALGIQHVGEETARDLAGRFGSIEAVASASLEELQKVRDIGGVVAHSFYGWFRTAKNAKLLKKFRKMGVRAVPNEPSRGSALAGKTFVLTGSLESMSREAAKERIRSLGGDVSESVSKTTDFVVVGSDPGSKYERARKLGVKTMDEKGFIQMTG